MVQPGLRREPSKLATRVQIPLGALDFKSLIVLIFIDDMNKEQPLADFVQEGLRVVKEGEKVGIILRVYGATGIRIHCQEEYSHLYPDLGRVLSDLDMVTYLRFRRQLEELFEKLGYDPDKRFNFLYGRDRQKYYDKAHGRTLDVFVDQLKFCHVNDLRGRLEKDNPTVPLANILLGKMQIVKFDVKDMKDSIILLREHPVAETDEDAVNARYIAKTLSDDWGFYYTVTTNLRNVKDYSAKYKKEGKLSEDDQTNVSTKIDELIDAIEKEPKSLGWKIRARVGTSKKWYTEVEEAP